MGTSASTLLPQDTITWRERVLETHADDVIAYYIKEHGLLYISLHGSARLSFFLVRSNTPLAFYAYEQKRMQLAERYMIEAFAHTANAFLNHPGAAEAIIDPDGETKYFHNLSALRVHKNILQRPEFKDAREISPRLLWWGMYNSDIAMAVSSWIGMVESFRFGNFEEHARRWFNSEPLEEQSEPKTDMEWAMLSIQKRTQEICVKSLRDAISRGRDEHRNLAKIATVAEEFYAACEVLPLEEESAKNIDAGHDESAPDDQEDEAEIEPKESVEPEFTTLRVPTRLLTLLKNSIHSKEI